MEHSNDLRQLSRRRLLQTTALAVGSGISLGCSTTPSTIEMGGGALNLVPNIDSRFSVTQRNLLKESVERVNQAMLSTAVRTNMAELGSAWRPGVDAEVWHKIQTTPPRNPAFADKSELLPFQLEVLSTIKLPISFVYFNEDSKRWGQTYIGSISTVKTAGAKATFVGDAEIGLNGHFVGSDERWQGTDPQVWAMVISHELLHCFGHTHGDRSELSQMIAFERCVYYNGTYKAENTCPEYECGARARSRTHVGADA